MLEAFKTMQNGYTRCQEILLLCDYRFQLKKEAIDGSASNTRQIKNLFFNLSLLSASLWKNGVKHMEWVQVVNAILFLGIPRYIFNFFSSHQCQEKKRDPNIGPQFSAYYLQCHVQLLFGTKTENQNKKLLLTSYITLSQVFF